MVKVKFIIHTMYKH